MHYKEDRVTERYLVPAHGPDQKQLGVAFLASIETAKKHACSITILIPTLKNAENTILKNILNESFLKQLVKGNDGQIEGIHVKLKSIRTINPHQETGIILVLWGGKEALAKADKARAAKSVIVIPWIPEDVDQWIDEWDPQVIEIDNA